MIFKGILYISMISFSLGVMGSSIDPDGYFL